MGKISKRAIWLISLVIFLLFVPFSSEAQSPFAQFITGLLGAAFKKYEAGVIFIFFIRLILIVLGWINSLLSDAITRALHPGLLGGWTYLQNPFVTAGLQITGGFISIGLVLVLVWIAFATILRLEGYDTGKLLWRLVIVGILVYFSRVICGLIVDASNIFMYYFTDKIGGVGVFTTTLHTVGQQIVEFLKDIVNPLAWPKRIAGCLIVISVQMYTATLLIAYLLTFLFRYAAIWIYVVLSPVAFICLILPATRQYWERWFKDFISWCLAGPICAFFLYLSARAGEIIESEPLPGGQTLIQFFANTFNQWDEVARIIPHFFTLGLLQLGVMLGIQATGWGGAMALRLAGQAGRVIGRARGKLLRSRATRWLAGTLGETPEDLQRAAKWLKRYEERPVAGLITRPLARTLERGAQVMAPYFLPYAIRAREVTLPKEFEKMTPEEQAKIAQSPVYRTHERIQILGRMAELGTLAKTTEEFQQRAAIEMQQALRNPVLRTRYGEDFKKFYNAVFHLMTEEAKLNLAPPEKRRSVEEAITQREKELREEYERNEALRERIDEELRKGRTLRDIAAGVLHFEQLRPGDVTKVPSEALASIEAIWGAHRMSPEKFQAILRTFDVETARKLLESPGGWNQMYKVVKGKPEEEVKLLIKQREENPYLFHWLFASEAGRYIPFPGREVMDREFVSYGMFRRHFPEYEKFVEETKVAENLRVLERQLVKLQGEYNEARIQKQKTKARLLRQAFSEIEERAKTIIREMRTREEVEAFLTRFGQLLLQPPFRQNPLYETLLSINVDLRRKLEELR